MKSNKSSMTSVILHYMKGDLNESEHEFINTQINEDAIWQDHFYYIKYLLDDLGLQIPNDNYDLMLLALEYEITAREESLKHRVKNKLKEREAYIELEPEIDLLLEQLQKEIIDDGIQEIKKNHLKRSKDQNNKSYSLRQVKKTAHWFFYRFLLAWNILPNSIAFCGKTMQDLASQIKMTPLPPPPSSLNSSQVINEKIERKELYS